MAHHLPGTPAYINGSVGVDIFFALSGWLITWLLMVEWRNSGRINLASFYIRRAFRIIPLYLVAIVLYGAAAIALAFLLEQDEELIAFFERLPLLTSFNGEYLTNEKSNLFGHAWTLGIEEKFYILWPALILFFSRRIFTGSVLVTAIVLSLIHLAEYRDLLLRGYIGLGFGAVLACIVATRPIALRIVSNISLAYGALLLIVVFYVFSVSVPHAYAWNLLISFCAAGLIGCLWTRDEPSHVSRVLSFWPISGSGRLTYAVYLTHVLVINTVVLFSGKIGLDTMWVILFAASYFASIAFGYVLHLHIERPLIRAGRTLSQRLYERDISRLPNSV